MSGRRIEAQAGEIIDRSCSVRFRFDGRQYEGYAGDTIASAWRREQPGTTTAAQERPAQPAQGAARAA